MTRRKERVTAIKPRFNVGETVKGTGPFLCKCGGVFAISEAPGLTHSLPTCKAFDDIDVNSPNCMEQMLAYMRANAPN